MAEWYSAYSDKALVAGLPNLALAPGATQAFAALHDGGVTTAIVSITWSFAVEWFARLLAVDHAYGTRLSAGIIDHAWPDDKGRWLARLANSLRICHHEIAVIGDSDGDRELLQAAGMRFFVGHHAPGVDGVAHIPDAGLEAVPRRILAVP